MTDTELPDQTVHPEADQWGGWQWENQPRYGEHFRRCSYCGSVSPEDLVAEPVWEAQWADQKYGWPHKFYVPVPNRDPERLYIVSSTNRVEEPTGPGWVAWGDLTPEQVAIANGSGYADDGRFDPPNWVMFGTHADHFGKFYTIHLRDSGLDPAVKAAIEAHSGIAFTFEGNRVRWGRPPGWVDPLPGRLHL